MTIHYRCPFNNCAELCPLPNHPVYVTCRWNARTYLVTPDGECEMAPWEQRERKPKWTHDEPRVRQVDPS